MTVMKDEVHGLRLSDVVQPFWLALSVKCHWSTPCKALATNN